jgi:predicted transposase/invertase (TIGR01784 family)
MVVRKPRSEDASGQGKVVEAKEGLREVVVYDKLPPLNDVVFQRLFDGEDGLEFLKHMLNAVLRWKSPIVKLEFLARRPQGSFAQDKNVEFDFHVTDQDGRRYDVEVQLSKQEFYAERATYYLARMYGSQLDTQKDYRKLRPGVGVHLLDWKFDSTSPKAHWRYELREVDDGRRLTDHLQLHILELPKFSQRLDELADDEQRWMFYLQHAPHLAPEQVAQLGSAIMSTDQKLSAISVAEELRSLALMRHIRELDRNTALNIAREAGLTEGHAQGTRASLRRVLARRFPGYEGWDALVSSLPAESCEAALDEVAVAPSLQDAIDALRQAARP